MKKIMLFLAAILFGIAFLGMGVSATQTLAVKNMPAIVSDTQEIQWDYSDSTNNRDQNCALYYSSISESQTNYIASFPCEDNCLFRTVNTAWSQIDSNADPISIEGADNAWATPTIFLLDNTKNFISKFSATSDLNGYTWNGSSWDSNSDLTDNILASSSSLGVSFDTWQDGSTTYLFQSNATKFHVYEWDGIQWIVNNDRNKNLVAMVNSPNISIVSFASSTWAIITDIASDNFNYRSFRWDGGQWLRNDYLVQDLNNHVGKNLRFDVFNKGSSLYAFAFTKNLSAVENRSVPAYSFVSGHWIKNSDINRGLNLTDFGSGAGVTMTGAVLNNTNTDILELFLTDKETKERTYWKSDNIPTTLFSEQSACFFSWDTTTAFDGLFYLDINVTTGIGDDIVSSSNRFAITNESYENIIIHDIENIAHTIDKNVVILDPIDDDEQFTFSVDANGFSGRIFYKILNKDKSLKQYFAYTADPQDYVKDANGGWSLNDTITFGSTFYDAIQKIWNNTDTFEYNWLDDLTPDSNKFYQFRYRDTMDSWFSVIDPDWEVQLTPSATDYNGINRDLFTASSFSDISNLLINELPIIYDSSLNNFNFVFQFNVFSDAATNNLLKVDAVPLRELNPTRSYDTQIGEQRITVKDLNNNFLKMITSVSDPQVFTFGLYNLIERGYFVDALEVLDFDNTPLPILITDANSYFPYIKEGSSFRIRTRVHDPDGKLDFYEVFVYVGSIDSSNKIKYYKFDLDDSGFIDLNPLLDGVIDLTANAPNRDLLVTIRVTDSDAKHSEVQQSIIKLRQFPTTPADIRFSFFQQNHKVGDNPQGRIELVTNVPNNIIGIKFQLEALNQDSNVSDYNKVYYKDTDFTCLGVDCSFDYIFDKYKFPREDDYVLKGWVLITTENESITNDFLYKPIIFSVYYKIFNTYRILQTRERSDFNYHNNEPIPLIVQVQDSDLANLQNEVVAKIRLWECATDNIPAESTSCFLIDINYSYDNFLYDTSTGYNYWFFNQIFLEEDLTRLTDGNFFRVEGLLEDKELKHQFLQKTLLTDRCDTIDAATFFYNILTMNFYNHGCTVYNIPFLSATVNQGNERRIGIQNSRTNSVSTQECFVCRNVDHDNVYTNALEQNLECAVIYKLGEQPIDKFRLYVKNRHSDLAQTDYAQFLEINIPAEIIYSNDIFIMQQSLNEEFATNTIDTIGEVLASGFNWLAIGTVNPLIDVVEAATSSGWIENYGIDCDLSKAIHPNFVSGILWYRVKGLKIINQKDYEASFPELENLDPSKFIAYSKLNNISIPENETTVEVFASDMKKVAKYTVPSQFIINEEVKYNPIKIENVDINSDLNGADSPKYETAPTRLKFEFISDMITNNDRNVTRRYVPMTLSIILTKDCGFLGINCTGGIIEIITKGDVTWMINNWFGIMMFVVAVLFIVIVYRSLRKEGGATFIFNPFKRPE